MFDIAETDGQALPQAPVAVEHVTGDNPGGLWDALYAQARNARLHRDPRAAEQVGHPDAKGVCNHTTRQIIVRDDLPTGQQISACRGQPPLSAPLGGSRRPPPPRQRRVPNSKGSGVIIWLSARPSWTERLQIYCLEWTPHPGSASSRDRSLKVRTPALAPGQQHRRQLPQPLKPHSPPAAS